MDYRRCRARKGQKQNPNASGFETINPAENNEEVRNAVGCSRSRRRGKTRKSTRLVDESRNSSSDESSYLPEDSAYSSEESDDEKHKKMHKTKDPGSDNDVVILGTYADGEENWDSISKKFNLKEGKSVPEPKNKDNSELKKSDSVKKKTKRDSELNAEPQKKKIKILTDSVLKNKNGHSKSNTKKSELEQKSDSVPEKENSDSELKNVCDHSELVKKHMSNSEPKKKELKGKEKESETKDVSWKKTSEMPQPSQCQGKQSKKMKMSSKDYNFVEVIYDSDINMDGNNDENQELNKLTAMVLNETLPLNSYYGEPEEPEKAECDSKNKSHHSESNTKSQREQKKRKIDSVPEKEKSDLELKNICDHSAPIKKPNRDPEQKEKESKGKEKDPELTKEASWKRTSETPQPSQCQGKKSEKMKMVSKNHDLVEVIYVSDINIDGNDDEHQELNKSTALPLKFYNGEPEEPPKPECDSENKSDHLELNAKKSQVEQKKQRSDSVPEREKSDLELKNICDHSPLIKKHNSDSQQKKKESKGKEKESELTKEASWKRTSETPQPSQCQGKKSEKMIMPSKDHDLVEVIYVSDMNIDGNNDAHQELNNLTAPVIDETLPSKFYYGKPEEQAKPEYDIELENRFHDSEYLKTSNHQIVDVDDDDNNDDDGSKINNSEASMIESQHCQMGKHKFRLNENIGEICIYCNLVAPNFQDIELICLTSDAPHRQSYNHFEQENGTFWETLTATHRFGVQSSNPVVIEDEKEISVSGSGRRRFQFDNYKHKAKTSLKSRTEYDEVTYLEGKSLKELKKKCDSELKKIILKKNISYST